MTEESDPWKDDCRLCGAWMTNKMQKCWRCKDSLFKALKCRWSMWKLARIWKKEKNPN